jgi:parallel beta-helix repeat protein
LALALLSVPGIAAARTRVVDDDGRATKASCDATRRAFASVQEAIDASAAGDTVRVCPGTYVGAITITGGRSEMAVVASKPRKAVIKAPDASGASGAIVTVDGVPGVTIQDLAIRALTWQVGDQLDGIALKGATAATIAGNSIRWAGPAGSLSHLMTGIRAEGGTTGTIAGNRIVDPREDGIHVTGALTNVTIAGNTVRSRFTGWSQTESDDGIEVAGGANADVTGNTLFAALNGASVVTKMAAGVELQDAAATTTVRENTITNPVVGITTRGDGYLITQNPSVIGRQVGIELLDTDGATVTANTGRATAAIGYGIEATEASDSNLISGNDVRDSFGPDCHEEDTDGTIDNAWSDNQSGDADPAGLCTRDAPPN